MTIVGSTTDRRIRLPEETLPLLGPTKARPCRVQLLNEPSGVPVRNRGAATTPAAAAARLTVNNHLTEVLLPTAEDQEAMVDRAEEEEEEEQEDPLITPVRAALDRLATLLRALLGLLVTVRMDLLDPQAMEDRACLPGHQVTHPLVEQLLDPPITELMVDRSIRGLNSNKRATNSIHTTLRTIQRTAEANNKNHTIDYDFFFFVHFSTFFYT